MNNHVSQDNKRQREIAEELIRHLRDPARTALGFRPAKRRRLGAPDIEPHIKSALSNRDKEAE